MRISTLRRPSWRISLAMLCLAPLAACGGGGGFTPPESEVFIDGLAGDVLMPDQHAGRIIEQEPNNVAGQAFRLPPFWPRSTLEVTGQLGTTAAFTGRIDPVDTFLFTSIRPQSIALELDFLASDAVSAAPNAFRVQVTRRATGTVVATALAGPSPRMLAFDVAPGEAFEIALTASFGHGWYVLRLSGMDLLSAPLSPKPTRGNVTAAGASPAAIPVAAPTAAPNARRVGRCAADHVLVRFDAGCDEAALCRREGLVLGRATATGSHRVRMPQDACGEAAAVALAERLAKMEGVHWAEPDWIVHALGEPDDPEFNRQWDMRAIGATSAWDIETGDPSVVVAIVDAGITAHPDLAGRTVPGYDFVSSVEIAGDGDGRDADPTDPGDQASSSGLSIWHGTHVASIIAARRNDGFGISGVAPDCRVMMLRALGIGGGLVSDASDAILFAAGLYTTGDGTRLPTPMRIINLSVGLDQDSAELRDACDRARNVGSFLVAAVGNNGGFVQFPARYDSTFAVAAVDGKLLTTAYSSFGSAVDLAAPGGGTNVDQWNDGWHDGVLGAVKDETVDPATWSHGYLVGTSQAAPHVAGAAALLLSMDPTLSAIDLATILRQSALDLGQPGQDVAYGAGLLQVHEAVKIVLARLGNPRSDAPYLLLPTSSVQFEGFRSTIDLPLANGGGGTLNVFFATGVTDDGGAWLTGLLDPATGPGVAVNMRKVTIGVERSFLPPGPGRYSGTLSLANALGTLGTVRVVVYVGERTRAGQILPLVAVDSSSGIARRRAYAFPEFGYRYWVRGLPAASYRLKAGEDLDFDGFFCEAFESCGWLGGPLEADAVAVPFVPAKAAIQGLSIELAPPP